MYVCMYVTKCSPMTFAHILGWRGVVDTYPREIVRFLVIVV